MKTSFIAILAFLLLLCSPVPLYSQVHFTLDENTAIRSTALTPANSNTIVDGLNANATHQFNSSLLPSVAPPANTVLTTNTYADPAWLTSLSWSKLTGVPAYAPTSQGVSTLALSTPNALFATPISFANSSNAWSGALTLNAQAPNTFLAGPATGSSSAPPTMRAIAAADIPALPYLASNTVLPANTSATANQYFSAYNSTTGAFTKTSVTVPAVPSTLAVKKGDGSGNLADAVPGADFTLPGDPHFAQTRAFQPSSLSGLSAWYLASDFAGLADGTAVSSWTDHSGNGYTATQSNSGNQPTKTTGYDGRLTLVFNGYCYLNIPSGLTLAPNSESVYVVLRAALTAAANSTGGYPIGFGTSDAANLFYAGQNGMRLYAGSTATEAQGTYFPNTAYGVVGFRSGTSGVTFHINDYYRSTSTVVSGTSGTGGCISYSPGAHSYYFVGEISEIVVFNRCLTNAEHANMLAYFARPSLRYNVICDGDSQTFGYQSATSSGSPIQNSYPYQMARMFGDTAKITNIGVSGETVATMTTNASGSVDPYCDAAGFPNRNIVCLMGGTNDISVSGDTGTQAYNAVVAYCQARHAAGWRVICNTILSRGDSQWNSTKEGYRQTCNSLIRANWPSFADGLADLDANPLIGGVGAYSNTLYYDTDMLHFTNLGYDTIARVFADAINRLTPPIVSTARLNLNGAGYRLGLPKTAAYTVLPTDGDIEADATSGAFAVTLHAAGGLPGLTRHISNVGTANNVTLTLTGSDAFTDGTASKTIAPGSNIEVKTNSAGTKWIVL